MNTPKLTHYMTTDGFMKCGSPRGESVWCSTDTTAVTCPRCKAELWCDANLSRAVSS